MEQQASGKGFFHIFGSGKPQQLKKILIIRFSSIGDIVLTSPVIRCLYEQVPDVEIHFLSKERFNPILKANPYIHKIHLLKDNLGELIAGLKKEKFDFVVDLHKNLRSARVKMGLGRPSASFSKLNYEKWLLVNFKIDKLPEKHVVDRYFDAVARLGVRNDDQGLDYFVPEQDQVSRSELPPPFRQDYIAMAIGGMHLTKMLPVEQQIKLCQMISKPIVLLGGQDDKEKAQRIAAANESKIFNGCGLFNINQSADILRQASKVITHDTGLMHIAAAFNKEIYSIWGNTVPEFGMYPYLPKGIGKSVIMQVKDLSCRPCSKIGYNKCPKQHFKCMMDIDLEKLAGVINAPNRS
jgi:ADP-heptose:LPS heptosyltransferase